MFPAEWPYFFVEYRSIRQAEFTAHSSLHVLPVKKVQNMMSNPGSHRWPQSSTGRSSSGIDSNRENHFRPQGYLNQVKVFLKTFGMTVWFISYTVQAL